MCGVLVCLRIGKTPRFRDVIGCGTAARNDVPCKRYTRVGKRFAQGSEPVERPGELARKAACLLRLAQRPERGRG